MANEVILEVKGMNTSFYAGKKEIRILKDVSLQLKKRTSLAIVGESGCGKSMTVQSIVRLAPVNAKIRTKEVLYRSFRNGKEREFRLDLMTPYGKEIRSLRGPEIGMIFQDPMASLNPVHRIGKQVAESLLEHERINRKEAMQRVLHLLKELGIPAAEQRIMDYPHQLSGGMKQRVMIAIAMICNPEILIADEPTTALDVTIQAQILELMKRLQTEYGKSIILITHNMGIVAEMADEIYVMYMGRIVEFGTVEDIFNHPLHPYTKALLKSVPVPGMDKRLELAVIPGSTPSPADLTAGCEYSERCPFCAQECRENNISGYMVAPGHMTRCLQYKGYPEVD